MDFFDVYNFIQEDFKMTYQVGLYLHFDTHGLCQPGVYLRQLLLLQITLTMIVGIDVAIAGVKLCVGVHTFTLAAPVSLALIDEPVVDLLQI